MADVVHFRDAAARLRGDVKAGMDALRCAERWDEIQFSRLQAAEIVKVTVAEVVPHGQRGAV